MAEAESVRIELAFDGGQIIGAIVAPETADAVERALAAGSQGTLQVDTDDGRLTVVVPQIVYFKRYAREAAVGFGI
ncbi:MAG: hypothetical protein OEW31_06340 [Thermoleophilia bacterium]|nr:hypothetical protein [Thermoleophilia bacterium]